MKPSLYDRILRRELGDTSRYSSIRGLYGDRAWVDDLEISSELGGHSGCVNALSWSTSGRLLASGSDDQHLNIHAYQPDSLASQFALTTTVSTGHTQNIFSVKFMPHSNDRTLVTCAGDAEVRVFDIEYSGQSTVPSNHSGNASSDRGLQFNNLFNGVKYLNDGNTNARVYRSHADRVKRIVTESSPNVFLTCSEDGEVRQFDLRLPSSAYPAPRGGRGLFARRNNHDDSNVPPPLISYKKFNLDLNTISCSGSQPHYIALGGAHLHCFLHDRRMLGRNRPAERGSPGSASPARSMSSQDDELMGQATQCVRKFAPNGRKKMRRRDNGHITACKISDANPNEMIASWSGDHIYSFDIVRSPDARDQQEEEEPQAGRTGEGKAKESRDRKRKRKKAGSSTSTEDVRKGPSRPRRTRSHASEAGDLAVRVRYENGQSEDIAMNDPVVVPPAILEETKESVLNKSQKRSMRIAKSMVRIRKLLFSLDASNRTQYGTPDLSAHRASFTSTLGLAATVLPEVDEIIRLWGYPMNPDEEDIVLQQTLRANRDSSRRFVQAAGTLSRLLGGQLQTAGRGSSPALQFFEQISPAPQEGPHTSSREIFSYDFLKAITLWLEGGNQALLQGFKRSPRQRNDNPRFPIPEEAEHSGIDGYLIPYLLRLARESPIPNVDASRFEVDDRRKTFPSESAAVIAFSHALRMPLEDLSRATMPAAQRGDDIAANGGTAPLPSAQDRATATRFWAFGVGRGVLMNAGEGVNFQFVDTAFGGLGIPRPEEGRMQEDIDPDEPDEVIESVGLVRQSTAEANGIESRNRDGDEIEPPRSNGDVEMHEASSASRSTRAPTVEVEEADSETDMVLVEDLHQELVDQLAEDGEEAGQDVAGQGQDDDGPAEDSEDDEDDDITAEERQFMFQSAADRGKMRERVEAEIPCYAHSREYRGHCNVRTVKDCNFFGLQDEYVVSGSDSGHLFIWDKKTSELVNILEGDGEVVNVVQGHPYEPLLAVSGIDHTIKIFSPDARSQEDARLGINGTTPRGSSGYSSISGRRHRPRRTSENEGLSSRKRMQESYQITSQNDAERQGGMRDAFITRGMLAQLAARLRARQGGTGGGEGDEGGEGGPMVIDDNCSLM